MLKTSVNTDDKTSNIRTKVDRNINYENIFIFKTNIYEKKRFDSFYGILYLKKKENYRDLMNFQSFDEFSIYTRLE